MASLRHGSIGLLTAISYSYIILVPLFKLALGVECFDKALAALIAFIGLTLILLDSKGRLKGILLSLSSSVCYAFSFVILDHVLTSLSPLSVVVFRGIFMALTSILLKAILNGGLSINKYAYLGGLLSFGIGGPLYITAVDLTGVIIPTVLTSISPVITQFITWFKLGERIGGRRLIGLIALIVGNVLAIII